MEVQPVVIHDAVNKGVERKPEPADEMRKKHNPLVGPRVGDELSLVGEPMRDVAGQVSGAAQPLDVPLREGGGHPFASRSGHGWRRSRRDVRTWALELECTEMEKQRRKKA